MRRQLVALVALVFVLAACGGEAAGDRGDAATPPAAASPTAAGCSLADGAQAGVLLDAVAARWDDAWELANQTPALSLAGPIAELQALRREVDAQDWPDCAEEAHGVLVIAMDAGIDALLAFMADPDDPIIDNHLEAYHDRMDTFERALAALARDE